MFTPIPPFTFRDDRNIPIEVNIKAAKVDAIRDSNSIWNGFMFDAPRASCFLIYSFNSGVVINSASYRDIKKSEGAMVIMVSNRVPLRKVSSIPLKSRMV